MSDDSKVWVSDLNARAEIRLAFPRTKVRFYDTTLRDGEQTVGVVFSPQQNLEIAHKLDELGESRIEAGFPRVSLWSFSRAVRGDVEETSPPGPAGVGD